MLASLIRLARPHHWVKNAFVVVPVPFALAAGNTPDVKRFLLGLLGFSLVSSAAYVINDIRDAAADRLNPAKRNRPVASGAVPVAVAAPWGAALAAAGLAACWLSGSRLAVVMTLLYAGLNLAYSFHLKHVPLLDVFVLASGFLIRVLLGCALIPAEPSHWLLVCASALALFLSFTKRRADLLAGVAVEHRPVLAGYSPAFLEQAMAIMCGITLLSYALYSIEASGFLRGRELAGMPFVTYALLQYLRLAYVENRGASPVELVFRSPGLQACAVGWLAVTVWSLDIF